MLENSLSVDITSDMLGSKGVLVKNDVLVGIESIVEERSLVLCNSSSTNISVEQGRLSFFIALDFIALICSLSTENVLEIILLCCWLLAQSKPLLVPFLHTSLQ